jgi:hypothetical protein
VNSIYSSKECCFLTSPLGSESCLLYPDNDPNEIGMFSKFIENIAAELVYLP